MKAIFILGFVAYASAGLLNTGTSTQTRSQDAAGNYAFSYDENHSTGGSFRRESGSLGGVSGSYGLRDIDGRQRIVNYVADGLGYRASILTNEPGTEGKESAAVSKAPLSAPVIAAAPVVHAPIPAPVVPAVPLAAPYIGAPHLGYFSSRVIHSPVIY